jgi:pimeloyl-ACP methyl ester carboxylesterase
MSRKLAKSAALALIGIVLLGIAYEQLSEWRARRTCVMRGRLVNVGGYKLHLYCIGHGTPAVVFDSGALDSSRQWNLVQPAVAKITQACSFDRAGLGWSDSSPWPASFRHNTEDLKKLLEKAGVRGPYVLVGHSNGGLDVQTFAHAYPNETAGMVLDDSIDAAEATRFPQRFETPAWARTLLKTGVVFGIPRLFGWCDHTAACPDCVKFTNTLMGELANYARSEAEMRNTASFGDTPLAVLEHDPAVGLSGERDEAFEQAWIGWQRDLAKRSSNSKLEVARGIAHEIQTDDPKMVINAVTWVIEQYRKNGTAASNREQ